MLLVGHLGGRALRRLRHWSGVVRADDSGDGRGRRLLGYVGQGQALSPAAVEALRRIKYCALAVVAFIVGAEAYIILGVESDDRAGGVAMGVFTGFPCLVAATAAAVLERVLQSAVDLKSDHDLTV